MDGVLDAPKPVHPPKSFSMDTDDPKKNRYVRRNILLRRHSSRSSSNSSVISKTSSTMESAKSSSLSKSETSTQSEADNHTCQYCGKSFTSKAGMYYHLPYTPAGLRLTAKHAVQVLWTPSSTETIYRKIAINLCQALLMKERKM